VDDGTLRGAISHKHLDYYLDEFTFRFNRPAIKEPWQLFFRLAQQAVAIEPVTLDQMITPIQNQERNHNLLGYLSEADT